MYSEKKYSLVYEIFKIFLFLFALFPIIIIFFHSLSSTAEWPNLFGTFSISSWSKTFFMSKFMDQITLTIIIGLLSTALSVCISYPISKFCSYNNSHLSILLEVIFLSPLVIPPLLITMGQFDLFLQFGLNDTILGVVITHSVFTMPYTFKSIKSGFDFLGTDYYNQIQMLRLTSFKKIFKIEVPMIHHYLKVGISIGFLVSVSQYTSTLLIGGSTIHTLPLSMNPYIQSGSIKIASVYTIVFSILAFAGLMFGKIPSIFESESGDKND